MALPLDHDLIRRIELAKDRLAQIGQLSEDATSVWWMWEKEKLERFLAACGVKEYQNLGIH